MGKVQKVIIIIVIDSQTVVTAIPTGICHLTSFFRHFLRNMQFPFVCTELKKSYQLRVHVVSHPANKTTVSAVTRLA